MSCPIAGSTEEARKKRQSMLSARNPDIAAASYAMFAGPEIGNHPPDMPMYSLATEMSQTRILRHGHTTVGEVLEDWHGNGVKPEPLVGTGAEIADTLIAFADDADIDGFVLTPLVQPMGTLDFVNGALPELDRRGARSVNDAEDKRLAADRRPFGRASSALATRGWHWITRAPRFANPHRVAGAEPKEND